MKRLRFPAAFTAALLMPVNGIYALTADEVTAPLARLLDILYAILTGIGSIVLAYNVFQLAVSIRSHDPTQRSNALLGVVCGLVIMSIPSLVAFIRG